MSNTPVAAPHDVSRPIGLTVIRGAMRLLTATAPGVASRVAADLFMKPRRFTPPAREQEVLATGTPFTVRLGPSMTIQAWRFGSGPAVVLVHGWEGRGGQLAPFVGPLVARGYSVIVFDAPGHGASDGSRSSLPHFTWALRGVVDTIEPPHAVIAHSLGCAATTLALRDGLSLGRLAFIAPPLDPAEYTNRFGGILGLDDATIEAMRMRIEERFLRKWSDYSLGETAQSMTAPLLVVHDRDDQDTTWNEGAELAQCWPGARLLTTEGLGHRRILRDPGVIEAVTQFVSA